MRKPRLVRTLGADPSTVVVASSSSGTGWIFWLAAATGLGYYLYSQQADAADQDNLPPVQPAPVADQTGVTTNVPTFADPATGVAIAGPSTSIQPTPSYTVQPNESWSNIASRVYGDYQWWPFLWDRNRTPTRYLTPDNFQVNDTISLPTAPPMDPGYQAAIFARALAHRAWWIQALKVGVANVPPMGGDILNPTPLPAGSAT